MNDAHGLTKENMLRALPDVLKNDARMAAIAKAIAETLVNCIRDTDKLLIYPNIDNLPEELLDILAYDFKVDWWDYSYSLEEKRRTLKSSWMVHRRLGTRWAVRTAIAAIYPKVQISEWFEYGGKPYHFRISIDDANRKITSERHIRLLQVTEYYKNLRSHLEIVEYHSTHDPAASGVFIGGAAVRFSRRTFCEILPDRSVSCDVSVGGSTAGRHSRETLPEVLPERHVSTSVCTGGGTTGRISRVVHKEAARSFTMQVYPAAGQGQRSSRVTIKARKE